MDEQVENQTTDTTNQDSEKTDSSTQDKIYPDETKENKEENKNSENAKKENDNKDNNEADNKDEAKQEDNKESDGDNKEDIKPEKYDLKVPEDSALPDGYLEKTEAYAKAQGFSNEEAQALINRDNEMLTQNKKAEESRYTELTSVEWPKQAFEDKEIGGEDLPKNAELAKRVLDKFGTDNLKMMFAKRDKDNPNGMGFGNNPDVLKTFARIGKSMSNDQLVLGPTGRVKQKEAADILYGNKESAES